MKWPRVWNASEYEVTPVWSDPRYEVTGCMKWLKVWSDSKYEVTPNMKWLQIWSDSKYEMTPGMRWTWDVVTGYLRIMIYQVQMLASKIINPSKSLEILKPKLWILKDYRTEMSDISNSSLRIDKSRIFWINFWIYHSCNSCVFLDCIFSLVLYFKLKKAIRSVNVR